MINPIRYKTKITAEPPKATMQFGSVMVEFYQLGLQAYRIVWRSKMTGATTSFISISPEKYQVTRQWALSKKLPEVNVEFDKRKVAFMHFLRNVDIIKIAHNLLRKAREFCTGLFATQENLPDIKAPDFRFGRLQAAIGRKVNIYSKTSKEHLIAKGHLLQLTGSQVEVHLSEKIDIQCSNQIKKFPTNCVFLV